MRLSNLLIVILVTLPFTNSVTLPIGFPLKIYEGVGLLALGLLFLGGGARLGKNHRLPFFWGVFLFGSIFASAWGLFVLADRDLSMLNWANGRYLPLINTAFHLFYLAFDIGLMVLVLHVVGNKLLTKYHFCKYWLIGSLASVIYALGLNLVLQAGLPASILLRWDKVQFMNVGGLNIARTGPFEEGNYFGLYLLASMIITMWASRNFPDRFFKLMIPVIILGVLITASPAALLGVVTVIFVAAIFGGVSPQVRIGASVGALVVFGVLVGSGLFQTLVLDKFSLILYGGVTDTKNVSLVQRMNESYHAWKMFLDNPQGVGIGNYGYFFSSYPDLYTWLKTDFTAFKPIANNVYLEVLSEHGAMLFILFVYLLYAKIRRLLFAREYLVAIGFLLVCVYFVAFPTFRLSLIWVFWGFIIMLGRTNSSRITKPGISSSS